MITTTNEIYEFVELAKNRCRQNGDLEIANQLDDAMQLGSSGLEILGAIKAVLVSQAITLEKLVDRASIQEVVKYVDQAYGIE